MQSKDHAGGGLEEGNVIAHTECFLQHRKPLIIRKPLGNHSDVTVSVHVLTVRESRSFHMIQKTFFYYIALQKPMATLLKTAEN